MDIDHGVCRKLTELLLRYTPEYSPSDTMLTGYASMAFQRLDQYKYAAFTSVEACMHSYKLLIVTCCFTLHNFVLCHPSFK